MVRAMRASSVTSGPEYSATASLSHSGSSIVNRPELALLLVMTMSEPTLRPLIQNAKRVHPKHWRDIRPPPRRQPLFHDEHAARGRAVVAVEHIAVIAVFPRLRDAVAAELAEHATRGAFAVAAIVLPVVALFPGRHDAIPAHGAAVTAGGVEAGEREL